MHPELSDQRVLSAGRSVTVEVPATSANLGPGFDCFGLALDWRERVSLAVIDQGFQIDVSGEGAAELPRDESHLIIRSALVGLADIGVRAPGLWLGCRNTIPHGRGLGSSSAAIVAGLVAAAGLAQVQVTPDWLLGHANAIEGHPDNVAAAIYGGFVLAYQGRTGSEWRRATLTPRSVQRCSYRRRPWRRKPPAVCFRRLCRTSMRRRTPDEQLCWSTLWRPNRTCSTTPRPTGCTRDIANPPCHARTSS